MSFVIPGLKSIKGKHVLLFLGLFLVVYVITNLAFMHILDTMGIRGVTLLDSKVSYTASDAYNVLNSFTEKGRHVIVYAYIMDFIIPVLYSLFFTSLTAYLISKNKFVKESLYLIALVPFIAGIFDYCENSYFLMMINNFSVATVNDLAPFSMLCTQLKAVFTVVSFLIIICFAIMLLWKKLFLNKSVG